MTEKLTWLDQAAKALESRGWARITRMCWCIALCGTLIGTLGAFATGHDVTGLAASVSFLTGLLTGLTGRTWTGKVASTLSEVPVKGSEES